MISPRDDDEPRGLMDRRTGACALYVYILPVPRCSSVTIHACTVLVSGEIMAASALGVTMFYLLMSQAAEFAVESSFKESKIVPDVISTAPPVAAKVGHTPYAPLT